MMLRIIIIQRSVYSDIFVASFLNRSAPIAEIHAPIENVNQIHSIFIPIIWKYGCCVKNRRFQVMIKLL